MIIGVQKEHGGHDPGLTGGGRSTVESPLQHRERLSKSLNKVMDFRQSLQRCAGPTGAGKSSPAEEKWSVCAGVRHAGDEEEGGTSLAYITGLPLNRKGRRGNRGKKC